MSFKQKCDGISNLMGILQEIYSARDGVQECCCRFERIPSLK